MKKEKKNALDLIRSNIRSHGYHIYVISGGPLPRFFYTIGLIESIGFELIMAGSYFYSANEAKKIFDQIVNEIKSHPIRFNSKIQKKLTRLIHTSQSR